MARRTMAVLVLVGALLAAAAPAQATTRARVYGDSIGARAKVQILNHLRPAYEVVYDATERAIINDKLPAIRQVPELNHVPNVVVVELGNGDANFGFGDGRFRRNIRQVLDALRAVPCVRWLDLKVGGVSGIYEGYVRRADDFNRILHREIRDYPNARVAPYREWARDHGGSFLADGLHHTQAGRGRYAAFVSRVVDGCP